MTGDVASPPDAPAEKSTSRRSLVSRNESRLRWALALALALGLAHTGYRAAHLGIEYFDGYDYLRNARALAGDPLAEYQRLRPPFVPIAQLPAIAIARASQPASPARLLAPHFTSALLSALSAAAVFWLFSRSFGSTLAALGTLLFMLTRYFVHYGPHTMADIPSAGWAAASTALYLRAREVRSFSAYAMCGLALGAGILTKYPLAVLGPAWLLAELWLMAAARRVDARAWIGIAIIGAFSTAIFLSVQAVVMRALFGSGWLATLGPTLAEFATMSGIGAHPGEHWSDYGAMSVAMLSLPTLLLCGGGVLLGLWRRDRRDVPQLASLAALAGTTVFVLRHNEARYLLPATPFILYFALRSIEAAHQALRARWSRWGRGPRSLALLIGIATLAGPLGVGLHQAWLDADPVYTADAQRRAAAQLVAVRRGNGRLLWNGNAHTLRTRWAGFVPHDEYLGIFHYTPFAAHHLLELDVTPMQEPRPRTPAQLALVLRDGDAVLRTSEYVFDAMHPPPPELPPMEVWSATRLRFAALGEGDFVAARNPDLRLSLRANAMGSTLSSSSLAGTWQVLLVGASEASRWRAGTVLLRPGSTAQLAHDSREPVRAIELFQVERTRID